MYLRSHLGNQTFLWDRTLYHFSSLCIDACWDFTVFRFLLLPLSVAFSGALVPTRLNLHPDYVAGIIFQLYLWEWVAN